MSFLLNLLALPLLGPPQLAQWLAQTIAEEAEAITLDEGAIRGQLLELQERYDVGELHDEAYDQQEQALLERLHAIREQKSGREV
jgi:hypothetical protein